MTICTFCGWKSMGVTSVCPCRLAVLRRRIEDWFEILIAIKTPSASCRWAEWWEGKREKWNCTSVVFRVSTVLNTSTGFYFLLFWECNSGRHHTLTHTKACTCACAHTNLRNPSVKFPLIPANSFQKTGELTHQKPQSTPPPQKKSKRKNVAVFFRRRFASPMQVCSVSLFRPFKD